MPRQKEQDTDAQSSASTSLVTSLPADLRAELLATQAASIQAPIDLVQLKMLGQGVGLFELEDEPGKTFATVRGIILHAHPSNVLWDKKYGAPVDPNDPDAGLPACASNDGIRGTPRKGFHHVGLNGAVGDGQLTVECASCPYNEWGSGTMIFADRNPNGKAVTNNRRVYFMLEGRDAPVEFVIPPTSITEFDEYSAGLLNKGIPLQAVVTEFTQTRKTNRGMTFSLVHPTNLGEIDAQTFQIVMDKRRRYANSIFPKQPQSVSTQPQENETDDAETDIPF